MCEIVKASVLIGAALRAVDNDDIKLLNKIIEVISPESLDVVTSDEMYITLISRAKEHNRKHTTIYLIGKWEELYPNSDKFSLYASLYINYRVPVSLIKYLSSFYATYTFNEIVSDLIHQNDNQNTLLACIKALEVYGEQSYEIYKRLVDKSSSNSNIYNFMVDKLKEVSHYAKTPPWINNSFDQIPNVMDLVDRVPNESFILPSDKEISLIIYPGVDVELLPRRSKILKEISMMSDKEKAELVKPEMDIIRESKRQLDVELGRILGPSNVSEELTTESSVYGGSRMFLCETYDYDEEDDRVYDWFTGSCEICFSKIKYKWYAVRMPNKGKLGGWEGQYCSWNCCRKDIVGEDIVTYAMIAVYEKYINKIGIQERLPDKDPSIVWASGDGIIVDEYTF